MFRTYMGKYIYIYGTEMELYIYMEAMLKLFETCFQIKTYIYIYTLNEGGRVDFHSSIGLWRGETGSLVAQTLD